MNTDDQSGKPEALPSVASHDLLGCPFCGSLEEPHAKYEHIVLDGKHALQCWNCGATGPFTVDDGMMGRHWNRREPVWNDPGPPNDKLTHGATMMNAI